MTGLQIRLDDPPPKIVIRPDGIRVEKKGERFRWLSSGGMSDGKKYYENGTGIPSYIHVVGDLSSDTLHITEGPLKADIASYLSGGELFIGLTGVQNLAFLKDVILQLKPKRILAVPLAPSFRHLKKKLSGISPLTNRHIGYV